MTKSQEQFEDETGMVAFGRGIDCKIYSDAYVEWLETKAGQEETFVMWRSVEDEMISCPRCKSGDFQFLPVIKKEVKPYGKLITKFWRCFRCRKVFVQVEKLIYDQVT